jgi:hypothetical protein
VSPLAQVDRDILQLLGTDVTWPGRKADAFTRIMTHGADALDVLTAAARASTHSGLYVGISHHAHTALQLVQGQLSAERVDSILAAAARGSPAGGAYTTTEVDTGGAASSGLSSQLQMSVTLAAQGEEDSVLEVALQLVGGTVPRGHKPRGRYCNMHVHVEGLEAMPGMC